MLFVCLCAYASCSSVMRFILFRMDWLQEGRTDEVEMITAQLQHLEVFRSEAAVAETHASSAV